MKCTPLLWNPNSVSRLTSPGVEITLISNIIRSTRRLPVDWIKLSLTKFDTTLKRTIQILPLTLANVFYTIFGFKVGEIEFIRCRAAFCGVINASCVTATKRKSKSPAAKSFIRALATAPGATMRRRLAEKRNFLINEAETRWCGGGRDSAFREQCNGQRKRSVLFSDSLSSLFHERAR